MNKDQTEKEQLLEAQKRIKEIHARIVATRDQLREGISALDDDGARRRLTDSYRAERRAEIRKSANDAIRGPASQALALATALKERRERVTGKESLLRSARLVELLPLDHDGDDLYERNQHRIRVNESRLLREELMRVRLRDEFMDASPDELTDAVNDAAATNNLAVLNIARRVLRKRAADEPTALVPAQSAMVSALEAITLPGNVAELERMFDSIDRTAIGIAEALEEIETGRAPVAPREATDRISELAAEHGPVEGPIKFAEERAAALKQQQAKASVRAEKEIGRAVSLDATDTHALNPAG